MNSEYISGEMHNGRPFVNGRKNFAKTKIESLVHLPGSDNSTPLIIIAGCTGRSVKIFVILLVLFKNKNR